MRCVVASIDLLTLIRVSEFCRVSFLQTMTKAVMKKNNFRSSKLNSSSFNSRHHNFLGFISTLSFMYYKNPLWQALLWHIVFFITVKYVYAKNHVFSSQFKTNLFFFLLNNTTHRFSGILKHIYMYIFFTK